MSLAPAKCSSRGRQLLGKTACYLAPLGTLLRCFNRQLIPANNAATGGVYWLTCYRAELA